MKGRTALVTGASRGLGAAIAARFETEGARVLRPARTELDLSTPERVDAFLRSFAGDVDILVNNAGINKLGATTELGPRDLDEVVQITLAAPLRLTSALAIGMKSRGYGRVLNLSSIWSFVSRERRVTYSAAKAGLNGLTRALAIELGPHGVLVNAIAPGFVDTELTRQNNTPEELERIVATIPLGRLARPAEIAEVAAFLCSSRNSYITGQIIPIDGGYLCR